MSNSYQQHPLSAAFPAMSEAEYVSLVDSITEIGVQNPITLHEGMVLDGWNRYRAAKEAGVECPSVELGDVDPRDFVLAQNKVRRHITQAQLIAAASAVFQWRPNGGNHSALSAECITSKTLAEKVGAGVRSVEQFRHVERKAQPEVIEAVKRGEIGLSKAAAIAKLPMEEQAEAIKKPVPARFQGKPMKGHKADVIRATLAAHMAQDGEPAAAAPPDYTELDRAHEQIAELQDALALANMGPASEEDRSHAATLITELRAENKGLAAELRAVKTTRDYLLTENAQMKLQMASQRREIEKLKAGVAA